MWHESKPSNTTQLQNSRRQNRVCESCSTPNKQLYHCIQYMYNILYILAPFQAGLYPHDYQTRLAVTSICICNYNPFCRTLSLLLYTQWVYSAMQHDRRHIAHFNHTSVDTTREKNVARVHAHIVVCTCTCSTCINRFIKHLKRPDSWQASIAVLKHMHNMSQKYLRFSGEHRDVWRCLVTRHACLSAFPWSFKLFFNKAIKIESCLLSETAKRLC